MESENPGAFEPEKWPVGLDEFCRLHQYPFVVVRHLSEDEMDYKTQLVSSSLPSSDNAKEQLFAVRKRAENPFSFITVGRARNNDIVVRDPSVSKCHISFQGTLGNITVTDMGSRNGTYHNGVVLMAQKPQALANEDELILSTSVTARFLEPASAYLWLTQRRG